RETAAPPARRSQDSAAAGAPGTPAAGEKRARAGEPAPGAGEAVRTGQVVSPPQEAVPDKAAAGPEAPVPLERVREIWKDLMDTLRKERLPLYPNYVKAVPLVVKGRGLVVGFPEGEGFSMAVAEQSENKKYLEELLGRFFEGEWQVAFKFYQGRAGLPERKQAAREPVQDVKRRFGGEEINLEEETEGTLF
ncbi:MAG: DNA polymerase III subunit gamma/tau, partial [Peptococcaceae bacterium]|nr:DNA polymerase III subunit gamma/tau [Peptococcaceae bacterium]